MNERFPSKQIALDGHKFQLHGIARDDPYWNDATDNMEPEFQRFCRRLVQPDYICLDVGANIGVKTLFLARHCKRGQVIAVEAGKVTSECLATNIAVNHVDNATLHHAVVAGQSGKFSFHEASAWGHLGPTGVEVEALTLEELLACHKLDRLDFIKIDIEGGEFSVLRNSLGPIARFAPLLYIEFNSFTLLAWGNTNPREFIEWICDSFRFVYAINRHDPTAELLTPVTANGEWHEFLHRNLVDDRCVTDLVMSNDPERFTPVPVFLEEQIQTHLAALTDLKSELTTARAELATARNELTTARTELAASRLESDAARSACDALLNSSSWRLTAPLRWIKQRLPHEQVKARSS